MNIGFNGYAPRFDDYFSRFTDSLNGDSIIIKTPSIASYNDAICFLSEHQFAWLGESGLIGDFVDEHDKIEGKCDNFACNTAIILTPNGVTVGEILGVVYNGCLVFESLNDFISEVMQRNAVH